MTRTSRYGHGLSLGTSAGATPLPGLSVGTGAGVTPVPVPGVVRKPEGAAGVALLRLADLVFVTDGAGVTPLQTVPPALGATTKSDGSTFTIGFTLTVKTVLLFHLPVRTHDWATFESHSAFMSSGIINVPVSREKS